jgi:penicillin-insensitive murein endopeptidase
MARGSGGRAGLFTFTRALLALAILSANFDDAAAQPKPRIEPKSIARTLFGHARTPAPLDPAAVGFYTHGCLAGGVALPMTGKTWQVMRPSRNRYYGHPALVRYIERLAEKVPKLGWNGLLVGDMAQARGGPMLSGHASHQVGLDADIWLTPMPSRELTRTEREKNSAVMVVARNRLDVDPKVWTDAHAEIIRAAANDAEVERIFVNPAIKKALCRHAGTDRQWLRTVRPWAGHDYHFHVRLGCPPGSSDCKPQDAPPDGDGCGAELDYWFKDEVMRPKPPAKPSKPLPPLTLADLPAACRDVISAP